MPKNPTYAYGVHRDKTSFRFEREMLNPIVSFLPTIFQPADGQRTRLLREKAVGSVIPDLMFGIWDGDLPRCSRLNLVSRQVLAWLATEKSVESEEYLRERLFLSEKASGAAISVLQRVGAVSKCSSGELQINDDFNPSPSIRLIAIEVKLKKWREALLQAMQYRTFADESYVALDASRVQLNATVRGMFVNSGIGLFLQNEAVVEMAIPAHRRTPLPSADRLFAISKFADSGCYCLA